MQGGGESIHRIVWRDDFRWPSFLQGFDRLEKNGGPMGSMATPVVIRLIHGAIPRRRRRGRGESGDPRLRRATPLCLYLAARGKRDDVAGGRRRWTVVEVRPGWPVRGLPRANRAQEGEAAWNGAHEIVPRTRVPSSRRSRRGTSEGDIRPIGGVEHIPPANGRTAHRYTAILRGGGGEIRKRRRRWTVSPPPPPLPLSSLLPAVGSLGRWRIVKPHLYPNRVREESTPLGRRGRKSVRLRSRGGRRRKDRSKRNMKHGGVGDAFPSCLFCGGG